MKRLQAYQVPGYRLQRMLGTGGMADVYEATQLNLDRTVAVKIRRGRTDEHELRLQQRFEQSAKLHAKLNHPNIVRVIDFVQTDSVDALILECLGGPSLEKRLRNHGPVPVPTLLSLTPKIIAALDYLHEKGFVHRDIKPSNLMHVTPDLDSDIRLMDFGVARDPLVNQELTLKGSQIGTLWYMSPEQLAGKAPAASCDLFALAVSLYELSTGHLPLSEREQSAVFRRHLDNEPIPKWATHIYDAYPEFCDLVEAALQVNYESRLIDLKIFGSFVEALLKKYGDKDNEQPSVGTLNQSALERNLAGVPSPRRDRLCRLLNTMPKEESTITISTTMMGGSVSCNSLEDTVLTETISNDEDGDGGA